MTFRLRAARADDLEPLYEMAKLTGGGFTNLPPDRAALGSKIERASEAFANEAEELCDEQFVLVLENAELAAELHRERAEAQLAAVEEEERAMTLQRRVEEQQQELLQLRQM